MEQFTEDIKATFAEPTTSIEKELPALEARRKDYADIYDLSPVATIPAKIHDLLQVGLRRNVELANSAIREINRKNTTSSFVLVRASFETSFLLYDAVRRVEKVAQAGDPAAIDELDKHLMDVLFGTKSKSWGFSEEYAAKNVLTVIGHIAKHFDVDFMWYYDGLSEHSHPNYFGMLSIYQNVADDKRGVYFRDRGDEDATFFQMPLGGLAISLEMLRMALDQLEAVLTPFAVLCETRLYAAGTWPADVPYPVPRGRY